MTEPFYAPELLAGDPALQCEAREQAWMERYGLQPTLRPLYELVGPRHRPRAKVECRGKGGTDTSRFQVPELYHHHPRSYRRGQLVFAHTVQPPDPALSAGVLKAWAESWGMAAIAAPEESWLEPGRTGLFIITRPDLVGPVFGR
jgi:hypothetical protein